VIVVPPVVAVGTGFYCYKEGLDKCEKLYPKHRDREHPDFVLFISSVAGVVGLGMGLSAEPIAGPTAAAGEAVGHQLCDSCEKR